MTETYAALLGCTVTNVFRYTAQYKLEGLMALMHSGVSRK